MNKTTNLRHAGIRWQLLTSVSAAALLASVYGAGEAQAADGDADRPTLWIELGGQLDRLGDAQQEYSPPFMASITKPSLLSALNVQSPPTFGLDMEGKISFQPVDSDWLFSASIRYGRSGASRHHHQQTANAKVPVHITTKYLHRTLNLPPDYYPTLHEKFADGRSSLSERNLVLDFQAGKDVGLGMFGRGGSSVLSAGVRIAQFTSKANVNLHAQPDVQYPDPSPIVGTLPAELPVLKSFKYDQSIHFHDYGGIENIERSFRGVGPSVTWNASVPFAGDTNSGELSLEWGANAALLFGRQSVKGSHKTSTQSYYENEWKLISYRGRGHFANAANLNYHGANSYFTGGATAHRTNSGNVNRMRSVTVPNLGGSVGFSYRIQDFKMSFGYKADMFFSAIDGGIDTRKSVNRSFFGPYASISVGLGD